MSKEKNIFETREGESESDTYTRIQRTLNGEYPPVEDEELERPLYEHGYWSSVNES